MNEIESNSNAPGDQLIKESGDATFVDDVIKASAEVPVIVDFWAPWCEPCKQLGPAIEKVIKAAAGAVKLVKIDIDQNPAVAQQLRIQSIPAVYAFKNGQPVDGFVGALPESQIKEFVERLAGDIGPTPQETLMADAKAALDAGDFAQAAGLYGEALRLEPGDAAALAGLAQCYIAGGDAERARQTLELVAPEDGENSAVSAARAALSLAEEASNVGDIGPLEAQVAADENDHQARFDLAQALVAADRREEGVDHLLEIVGRKRTWNDDGARKQLLTLFEAFGAEDEVTIEGRRRLSLLLFS